MTQPTPPKGFTLLECMIALMLLATAAIILVQSQTASIRMSEDAQRIDAATMLCRDVMTELELRMEKEGFGELEVSESGNFSEDRYGGHFEDYRWEYEVEKVDMDIPNLNNLLDLLGDAGGDAGEEAGVDRSVTEAAGESNPAALLQSMGFDFGMITEMMGNYLREARVRVCWKDGEVDGKEFEDCVEVLTHLTNPTGTIVPTDDGEGQ